MSTALPNGLIYYPAATGAAGIALNDNFTALDPLLAGVWPDNRISESSVTQHQEALSITESQISDLQNYITSTLLTDLDVDGNAIVSTGDIDINPTGSVRINGVPLDTAAFAS